MSEGFRLHPEKDKDILDDLNRFKAGHKSKRIKEMYRKGIELERTYQFTHPRPANWIPNTPAVSKEPLNWKFPSEPSVPQKIEVKGDTLKKNILKGF